MMFLNQRVNRRQFLGMSAAVPAAALQAVSTPNQATSDQVVEEHRGDPEGRPERLAFDSKVVEELITGQQKASFAKYDSKLPSALISGARSCVGFSRETHEEEIAVLLALFKLPFRYSTGAPVPFCAAGLSFVAAKAYAVLLGASGPQLDNLATFRSLLPDLDHYYFYPSPSVRDMYHIAAGRRRWRPVKLPDGSLTVPKPGWLVLFQFGGTEPDHCGVVTSADAKRVHTIEFNTSGKVGGSQRDGGVVAERDDRTYDRIKGFIDITKAPAQVG